MYGLLGRKLGHSLSPQIYSLIGADSYELFCREPDELDAFFADEKISAFNVTIPYKIEAFNRCDELSETARKIGSVNTVVKRADGTHFGDNTDYYGFMKMAEKYDADFRNKKVVILGSGGAAKTVLCAVNDSGAAEAVVVSRSGENNYENLYRHYDANIIVNATPVGMFPENGKSSVDLSKFKNPSCVLDLIYNPARTQLLLEAEKLGIPCGNGLYMLVAQGLRSAEIFFGKKYDDSIVDYVFNKIKTEISNIILTGMPGCGKTTAGRILAEKIGKTFIDSDEEIEKKINKKIPEIFTQFGEEFFRKIETEAIKEIGKELGCIIATGGGAVLKKENRDALKQNGTVVYLKKDLSLLSLEGRPLSKNAGAVDELYRQRKEIYESFADFTVRVGDSAEETAERVIKCLSL